MAGWTVKDEVLAKKPPNKTMSKAGTSLQTTPINDRHLDPDHSGAMGAQQLRNTQFFFPNLDGWNLPGTETNGHHVPPLAVRRIAYLKRVYEASCKTRRLSPCPRSSGWA
jgi:hypothetical protein